MKRVLCLLLSLTLILCAGGACAQKARGISGDAGSAHHAAHLRLHTGGYSVTCAGRDLNVRETPAPDGKPVGILQPGDSFTLEAVQGSWAKIEKTTWKDRVPTVLTGWVSADYLDCECSPEEYLAEGADWSLLPPDTGWKRDYAAALKELLNEYPGYRFSFLFVDGDEIPEIAAAEETSGSILLTWKDGRIDRISTLMSDGWSEYLPGRNLLHAMGGRMGDYWDCLYTIEDGRWVMTVLGSYVQDEDIGLEGGLIGPVLPAEDVTPAMISAADAFFSGDEPLDMTMPVPEHRVWLPEAVPVNAEYQQILQTFLPEGDWTPVAEYEGHLGWEDFRGFLE